MTNVSKKKKKKVWGNWFWKRAKIRVWNLWNLFKWTSSWLRFFETFLRGTFCHCSCQSQGWQWERLYLFMTEWISLDVSLRPAALNCWERLLALSLLSIVHRLLFCLRPELENHKNDIKPSKLLLSAIEQRENGEKGIRKQRKKRKQKGEQQRGIYIGRSLGGKWRLLHVTTCWVTEGFVWSVSCVVRSLRFHRCQKRGADFYQRGKGMFPLSSVTLHWLLHCFTGGLGLRQQGCTKAIPVVSTTMEQFSWYLWCLLFFINLCYSG